MNRILLILLSFALLALTSCGKEDDPFADKSSSGDGQNLASPDAKTIAGLHKNIFQPKCAIESCHGGTFEPDFRTVESSYFTLVYAPVVKNTPDERFRYRVVPRDTVRSWLYRRVTKHDTLNPRMPIYMEQLTQEELTDISTWIMNGAPDMEGKLPQMANLSPSVYGYNAYNASFIRIDENRAGWDQPFNAPHGQNVNFWVFAEDAESESRKLQLNEMKFSLNPNDFSSAITVKARWMDGPVCWGWVATVNTSQFPAGSLVYMRYYTKDPITGSTTEMPSITSYSWFKGNFSFRL
jgi:hypothetical protein